MIPNVSMLPSVDAILKVDKIKVFIEKYGHDEILKCIRGYVDRIRDAALNVEDLPDISLLTDDIEHNKLKLSGYICDCIENRYKKLFNKSLKKVINATGIILHTNLGRAPYGKELIKDVSEVLSGYTNLEYDLDHAKRGNRYSHASNMISYITKAEDVLIVNNNAAAIMFVLKAFADHRESIVSRGELIEIGGSFRVPDVMEISGSIMHEVGTTNKTKLSDYKNAINENSAVLFKAHRSNFSISGFTEEVSLKELADLANEKELISVFDMGSGLLTRIDRPEFDEEPIVKDAVKAGIDLICFSGDKILGGPQAGIIAGKKKYIDVLKNHPMLRALRVGKETLAILESVMKTYFNEDLLNERHPVFKKVLKSWNDIVKTADTLKNLLTDRGIESKIINSRGYYGGGTMPDVSIESAAVKITFDASQRNKDYGKKVMLRLLQTDAPVLVNLKAGNLYIDVLCLESEDLEIIADRLRESLY
ncbi:MAG: L-seryl-tRNA(Sec) selenium transferase [Bacteroidales bacterium]